MKSQALPAFLPAVVFVAVCFLGSCSPPQSPQAKTHPMAYDIENPIQINTGQKVMFLTWHNFDEWLQENRGRVSIHALSHSSSHIIVVYSDGVVESPPGHGLGEYIPPSQ